MKKTIFLVLIFLISHSVTAQNTVADNNEELTVSINEILNFPVFDLTNNNTITDLKTKIGFGIEYGWRLRNSL